MSPRVILSAPIWMASPPEVHSASLRSGPGPGPLLAAAGAWSALGTEYAATAEELTAVLAAVQAGAWQGPSAEQYVAAHGPYLNWLLDSAATSTAAAALHQTAAGAYTGALAAMPTLAELTANHAVHGALVATNFFGINTIPIAVNEADYVRMWLQAASTMTTYQTVSDSALAAVPATAPAPPIVAPSAAAASTQQQASTAADTGSSWQDQLAQWITDYNMGFADPLAKWLFYPDGYPISPMPLVNALTPLFSQIPGIAPGLASALAWTVFHNLMLVFPLIQAGPLLMAAAVPAALAATGAVGLAGLAGVAGVAGVADLVPAPAADLPAAGASEAPLGTGSASATPGGTETSVNNGPTAPSSVAPSTATAPGGGPSGGGPGVGFGPTDALYAVGMAGLSARSSASSRARRQSEEPASHDAAAPAATAALSRPRALRRRRAGLRGHGDEYMEMNVEVAPDWGEPALVGASDRGAGALGFAGASVKSGVTRAAGLTTLDGGAFGNGPTAPMMPHSWSD